MTCKDDCVTFIALVGTGEQFSSDGSIGLLVLWGRTQRIHCTRRRSIGRLHGEELVGIGPGRPSRLIGRAAQSTEEGGGRRAGPAFPRFLWGRRPARSSRGFLPPAVSGPGALNTGLSRPKPNGVGPLDRPRRSGGLRIITTIVPMTAYSLWFLRVLPPFFGTRLARECAPCRMRALCLGCVAAEERH